MTELKTNLLLAFIISVTSGVISGCSEQTQLHQKDASSRSLPNTSESATKRSSGVNVFKVFVDPAMRQANQLFEAGQFSQCNQVLDELTAKVPGAVAAYRLKAKAHLKLGNQSAAVADLKKYFDPHAPGGTSEMDDPEIIWECLQIARNARDEDLEISCWDQLAKEPRISTRGPNLWLNRDDPTISKRAFGKLRLAMSIRDKKPQLAMQLIADAQPEFKSNAAAHYIAYYIYNEHGQIDKAKNHLHQCLIRTHNDTSGKREMVRQYFKMCTDIRSVFVVSEQKRRYFKIIQKPDGTETRVPYTPYPYLTTPPLPPGQ